MKKNKYFVIIAIILMINNFGYGQKKALFIHGFGGDTTTWHESNTISDLKNNGIINKHLNIGYEAADIPDDPTQMLDFLNNTFVLPVINSNVAGTDKWIIIGHSLGGMIARFIEPMLSQANINVVGILTLGTPHQGARSAWVTETSNPTPPLYNPFERSLDEFKTRIDETIGFIPTGFTYNPSTSVYDQENLSYYLNNAFAVGHSFVTTADNSAAGSKIGPNGSMISEINNVTIGSDYRSIIGAEKGPIPIRWVSEFPYLSIGSNESDLATGYSYVSQFYCSVCNSLEATYQYLSYLCFWFGWLNNDVCEMKNYLKEQKDKWGRGKSAWNGIDTYWAKAIDTYQPHTTYMQINVCLPCEDCTAGGGGGVQDWDVYFNDDCCHPIHGCWRWIWTSVTVMVPNKSDGLLEPKYCRWKVADDYDDGIHNFYHSDEGTEGGYNHSELKRYTRAYPPNQGQVSIPWQQAGSWMFDKYNGN